MAKLTDPITILKGVGPTKAKQFAALGVYTLQDLICHFPRGYEDRTKLVTIDKLQPDVPACFQAMVMQPPRTAHIRKGLDVTKVQVADHTARLNLTFFNQKFTTDKLQYGKEYIFYGAVSGDFIGYNMTSPVFEEPDAPPVVTRRILPIYPLTAGLSNGAVVKAVEQALAICNTPPEILPKAIRDAYDILPAERAYYAIHQPVSMQEAELAKKRLIFEEFFVFSAGLSLMRAARADKRCPAYENLEEVYRYQEPLGGIGLVRMKTPMLNCVDGSQEGVSVYSAVAGLIHNINANEAQLNGEFSRGESRVILSRDMLRDGQLQDHLFVGLDEDPENVGITVFSPPLRVEAYLARKQEYFRNVESLLGLKRGMLSDANMDDRTATEIASSAGDFNLTVIDFQQMWQEAVERVLTLCAMLSSLYALPEIKDTRMSIDWGNGVLYDEEKKWAEYQQMVDKGLLKPEIALGWRFNLSAQTESDREHIRKNWMPASE